MAAGAAGALVEEGYLINERVPDPRGMAVFPRTCVATQFGIVMIVVGVSVVDIMEDC